VKFATHQSCEVLRQPEARVLNALQRMTLTSGTATITYTAPDGSTSMPIFWAGGTTLLAWAGPIRIEISPLLKPTTLCGQFAGAPNP